MLYDFESYFCATLFGRCALILAGQAPGREVNKMATKKIGRSARTGRFMPVKTAQQQKATSVVETIKTDSKKGK